MWVILGICLVLLSWSTPAERVEEFASPSYLLNADSQDQGAAQGNIEFVSLSSTLMADGAFEGGIALVQLNQQSILSSRLHQRSKESMANTLCNDGEKAAKCLDVEACASRGPENGRYAFVLSFGGDSPRASMGPFLPYLHEMSVQAQQHNIDILFIIEKQHVRHLRDEEWRHLRAHQVKVLEVEWSVPPNMKFVNDRRGVRSSTPWCGPKDFIRLHALALDQYDAVLYYDSDVELRADVTPLLRCAATGRLLTTTGANVPLNMGTFAVRPDPKLLQTALNFAQRASFNSTSGWAGAGFKPSTAKFFGAECGQGFFHTLFYKKNNPEVQLAFQQVGNETALLEASMVDRCVWNYQGTKDCLPDFDCAQIRAHHKFMASQKNDEPRPQCNKLRPLS